MAIQAPTRKTENIGTLLQQHADDTNKIARLAIENVRMRGAIQEAMDKPVIDEFDAAYEILERAFHSLEFDDEAAA